MLGRLAGLGAALALAVLPIALLTARSDTMDSVAMVLSVVTLWLLVRFGQSGSSRWAYLAAAAMGLAFNVKLFQGLVALPALALFGVLVCRERRLRRAALATLVFLAVALSWLSLTLLFPASQRPYAIGSTNGSAWNASFVYNGYDRITGAATNSGLSAAQAAAAAKPANNSELARAAVPIGTPGALRLFDHNGPLSGLRLGFVLLTALLLGVPALLFALLRARGPDRTLEQAFAASLLAWLATGIVPTAPWPGFTRATRRVSRRLSPRRPGSALLGHSALDAHSGSPRRSQRSVSLSTAATCSATRALCGVSAPWRRCSPQSRTCFPTAAGRRRSP